MAHPQLNCIGNGSITIGLASIVSSKVEVEQRPRIQQEQAGSSCGHGGNRQEHPNAPIQSLYPPLDRSHLYRHETPGCLGQRLWRDDNAARMHIGELAEASALEPL